MRAKRPEIKYRVTKQKLTKSEQMSLVRTKDTAAEQALRKALWAAGLRYRLNLKLPGKPDIVFQKQRLAIFVDGCFWHGCPLHYSLPKTNTEFWKLKHQENTERDSNVNKQLEALSWNVLRVWEHEIEDDLPAAVQRVRRVLFG